MARYLNAGIGTLIDLRVTGLVHNVGIVLLGFGAPVSAIGLLALPWTARGPTLRALLVFSILTFVVTTGLFPVATTWGTFQHAAGAIEVLLVISAVLALDAVLARVGEVRGWTRPVAWLGPALTIAASLLFAAVLLPGEGDSGRATEARYAALPAALAQAGVPLESSQGPVITDSPLWLAEETGHTAIALPDESPTSIIDLADHFGASLVVVQAGSRGAWQEAVTSGAPDSACFVPVPLAPNPALDGTLVFRIDCP